MKKFFKIFIIIMSLVICSYYLNNFFKQNSVKFKVFQGDLRVTPLYRGLKGAITFKCDLYGNCYVVFKDRIQKIENSGKSYDLFKDNDLDIMDAVIDGKVIFYSSNNKVYQYNCEDKTSKCIINNIPNYGDYKKIAINKYENHLYISIGSATNSGIVGPDNLWTKNSAYNCDLTPKTLIIKGTNFGREKTGAFVPYGTSNIRGQIIPAHVPGNASIVTFDLDSHLLKNYAYGIRCVADMDFSSKGKLIAIVGGMENRGLRPIKGDTDYVYSIEKDEWYGWPDYSGGYPVNDKRFKGLNGDKVNFILDKHPSTKIQLPIYKDNNLNSLLCVSIDKKGIFGKKDAIFVYDKKENKIFTINRVGEVKELIQFSSSDKINSLQITPYNMMFLDSNKGVLYKCSKLEKTFNYKNNKKLTYIYVISLVSALFFIIICIKLKKIFYNKNKI
ncbi:hypothetical protein ACER0A_006135 [Haloimpatiens sp. FM7315]|uniref:hypothetical protein n=1 Tax=Haloimpatiens sp. FM7315 TaxID=3298609 RepID=UPI0035A37360